MQNQHKTGLVLIIGILMGAVLVLLFVVFFGNNVAILPMKKQQKTYTANNQQKNKQQTAKRQNKTYIYRSNKNQYSQPVDYQPTGNKQGATTDKKNFETRRFVIDLNTADTLGLQLVRGIGKVFARRIYNYGKRLGGYYDKSQLKEVKGINDTVFLKISPQIILQDTSLRKININTDNIKTLYYHPYIDYYLAKAIIRFRKQYGDFSQIEDIKKVHLMDEQTFEKLAPYLEVK